MYISKFRFPLLIISFVLLIAGAVLRYMNHPMAWVVIGIAVVLYIIARFLMREKKKKSPVS